MHQHLISQDDPFPSSIACDTKLLWKFFCNFGLSDPFADKATALRCPPSREQTNTDLENVLNVIKGSNVFYLVLCCLIVIKHYFSCSAVLKGLPINSKTAKWNTEESNSNSARPARLGHTSALPNLGNFFALRIWKWTKPPFNSGTSQLAVFDYQRVSPLLFKSH